MKKLAFNLAVVSTMIFVMWMTVSYLEIICKNVRPNPQYSNYNLIVNLTTSIFDLHTH